MKSGPFDISLEHVLDAPPAAVFDTYVDPEADRTIFTGGPDWTVEVACDLRVGGLWTISSAAPAGPAYYEVNRFTAIERPGHLAFASTMTMPDGSKVDRDVDVTLTSVDGTKTRMAIVQMGFPSREAADAFGANFPGVFARMEKLARDRVARAEAT